VTAGPARTATEKARSFWAAAAVYRERRVAIILLLGFSSGLPLLLVYATLSAWLKESGVSLTAIGLFSWASTAYAIKFLWSPLVDRWPLPALARLLGQRRGWLVSAQLLTAGGMLGLGTSDPATDIAATALWAVFLAFASATQDIVIDAYRVESLDEHQQGAGAATYTFGYRLAMLASGAGALIIAEIAGWFAAYATMAGLMGIGFLTALMSPEPARKRTAESVARERQIVEAVERFSRWPARLRGFAAETYAAVICPFADFMARPHWLMILLFIALYKYGDALLGVMANPFYLDIGFSKSEIAVVSKFYGMAMTVLGGLLGGMLAARYGILKALLIGGIAQALSNLAFAAQAAVGYSVPMLTVTISIENFTGGIATIAFIAYLSSLCNIAYTATQFALLSSLMAFARTIFASGGGWLADHMDWVSYFLLTTLAAVPGILLLLWLMKKFPPDSPASRSAEP
jgi:PAT family beta-lactamase induction signal transducer AmpG